MSDPVKNADIEDVLSSIRRLLSDDPCSAEPELFNPSDPEEDNKLVLTPSLRVADAADSEESEPPAEDPALTELARDRQDLTLPWTEDAMADGAASAGISPLEGTGLGTLIRDELRAALAQHSAKQDNDSAPAVEDWGETRVAEPAPSPEPPVDQPTLRLEDPLDVIEPEEDDSSEADHEATPKAVATDPLLEVKIAALQRAIGRQLGRDPENPLLAEPLVPDSTAAPEPDSVADPEPEIALGAERDLLAEPVAPHADDDDPGNDKPVLTFEAAADTELSFDAEPEALPGAQTADPSDDEAETLSFEDAEEVTIAWQDYDPDPATRAEIVLQPDIDGPDTAFGSADDAAEAPELDDTDPQGPIHSAAVGTLDDAALRALVSDIVREELQGVLGERITRNVRKLVRREIHRLMLSQDLG